ncbi:AfsR/SARP family transcriptional regulator [Streptomyces sp. ST2-7A]|nr:AfsR/SARP family transcriptional regulator [Streptomyces sp. ST2-7A]
MSTLIGELWDVDPPNSAVTTLQTYILNLRKLLASATERPMAEIAQEVLVTRAGGYLIKTEETELDFTLYHEKEAAGRRLISAGKPHAGIAVLDDALNLWRGPALIDVRGCWVLEIRRLRLEESRLAVLEKMIETQIRLGMYREVLPSLVALAGSNPLHEGIHAQYMRALYLSGRRTQALKAFQELRCNLVRELGTEPGRHIQRLHQAILVAENDALVLPHG